MDSDIKPVMYNSDYSEYYCDDSCESTGTMYEEDRCRVVEKEIDFNSTTIDSLLNKMDWSFDPFNKNQGKQWKK